MSGTAFAYDVSSPASKRWTPSDSRSAEGYEPNLFSWSSLCIHVISEFLPIKPVLRDFSLAAKSSKVLSRAPVEPTVAETSDSALPLTESPSGSAELSESCSSEVSSISAKTS